MQPISPNIMYSRSTLLSLVVLCLAACQSQPQMLTALDPDLVNGQSIFGAPVAAAEPIDLLAVSPAMQAFVKQHIGGRLKMVRHRQLLRKLREHGYFEGGYAAQATHTAAEAFATNTGNCLTYTAMYVALARAADIPTSFQIVELPHPTWAAHAGVLVRNNHINAYVHERRTSFYDAAGDTVDFNLINPDPEARSRRVSDAYAYALFYANLSAEALIEGERKRAFALLRRALQTYPDIADLWVNLGAFYSSAGVYHHALQAYQTAYQLNPHDKLIWTGLARSYEFLGESQQAQVWAAKVRNYQQRNPYYHFAKAQLVYEANDLPGALAAVERAIELRGSEARFHFFKGLIHYRLGQPELGRPAVQRARQLGDFGDLFLRYATHLEVGMRGSGEQPPPSR